ncbi:MAG: cytochrome c biogenesis protein [Planctomycetota bacterium]|jgi:ABC-type transport system involved in cytochrome c biogenesis permease subunit
MASEPISTDAFDVESSGQSSPFVHLQSVLRPLASLKLTVVLFAFSMILVMAGTLAQVDLDIWDVVREYFRCWFAWVPVSVWHPLFARIESFEPIRDMLQNADPGFGFWFPGGYLLGTLMAMNLFAAHLLRFKVQAKGTRLGAGLIVTAIGCLVTWMVIASGDGTGLQQTSDDFYDTLWSVLNVLLVGLLVLNIGGAVSAVRRGKSESPLLICSAVVLAGVTYWVLFEMETRISSSSMRILWQLVKAETASLILLGGCYLLFKKRAGVTLLHAGVALVMVNEVVVDTLHVETQMAIEEGHTVNFAKDIREIEFAVVDKSSPDFDEEIIVRRNVVLAAGRAADAGDSGNVLSDPELPFDIEVLEFMQNSNIEDARPGAENRATAGAGLQLISTSAKPTTGTDSSGRVDLTAAYVRVIDKESKEDLGVYLTGVVFELLGKNEFQPNRVTVDGKDWEIALRFRRFYKPYSVHLSDVSKTDYIGTNTPMDYRSIVDVIDAESGEVLVDERHIWMNNPMRYSGDTFYQSNYAPPNPRTGEREITTLSVVSNTGWMIPYMSCMIVGTGMLAHFFAVMLRFLNRRTRSASAPADPASEPAATRQSRSQLATVVPVVLTVVICGWAFSKARVPSVDESKPDVYAFGKLPVVYEGRVKPLDTVARNSLRALSNREEWRDADGNKQPAIKWMLDVISGSDDVRDHAVFRIDHPQVIEKLDLARRERHLYSINDIAENVAELAKDAAQAREKDSEAHTPYDTAVLALERKVGEFDLLASAFNPPEIRQDNVQQVLAMLQSLSQRSPPLAIPPTELDAEDETDVSQTAEWETVAHASVRSMVAVMMGREENKQLRLFADILDAHLNEDAEDFNAAVDEYQGWLYENGEWLQSQLPKTQSLSRTGFEAFYNHFAPFYYAAWCYLFAFVITAIGLLGWSKPLNRSAFLIILVTLVLHTFALGARIYISGRPPVTNLYSSAVFIGWGCVIAGLIFESLYKIGVGNLIASALGAAALGISYLLSGDGDTFAVLQAVLDTQFWLATHVVTVAMGYSATFLAGHLGVVQIVGGLFTPWMTKQRKQDLTRMIYGTVCFGMFFSFVGTVLGGLWADDSWGRFWGWDPKENGALLIVIWNALLLHARWDRLVSDRGFANLAIAGNIVTSWSWFGVNELGIGLHSYGFTDGVWLTLWCYWISQIALIALGLIPWRDKPAPTADVPAEV